MTPWNRRHVTVCSLVIVVCCLLPLCSANDTEIYSSTGRIKYSMRETKATLKAVLPRLDGFISNQKTLLDNIKGYIRKLNEISGDEIRSPDFTILHPLNSYRFIRNHSIVYQETVARLLVEIRQFEKGIDETNKLLETLPSMSSIEYNGLVEGILRLHSTYDLDTSDMADGNFGGVESGLELNAEECAEIMKIGYPVKLPAPRAIEARAWLREAIARVARGDNSTTATRIYVQAAETTRKMKLFTEANVLYKKIPKDAQGRFHKLKMKRYFRKTHASQLHYVEKQMEEKLTKTDLLNRHDILCQGRQVEPTLLPYPRVLWRNLVCRYLGNNDPLLWFQPVKLEERSLDPYIAVLHEIAYKQDIKAAKNYAQPRLKRSTVQEKGHKHVKDPGRTSQSMFIYNSEEYEPLARRIEAATGLAYSAYEKFQIANYGVGSHYYVHHDYFDPNYHTDDIFDNRVATFMVYMSDVERGGATVFPDVGVATFPKAGDAIFWYNLFKNGTVHKATRHAACPVLVGDKWVGNIWIHRNGQEFKKPCSLDIHDRDWSW